MHHVENFQVPNFSFCFLVSHSDESNYLSKCHQDRQYQAERAKLDVRTITTRSRHRNPPFHGTLFLPLNFAIDKQPVHGMSNDMIIKREAQNVVVEENRSDP
jgi:hypothetical protein